MKSIGWIFGKLIAMQARKRMVMGVALLLVGCGIFGGAVIGGTVSGLATGNSVVLQNNGTESLTVSANGAFQFVNGLDSGDTYSVGVQTQPNGQTCTVTSGSGTINTNVDDVTSIVVACSTTSSLSAVVTGLTSGTSVTLSNAGNPLIVGADGTYFFPNVAAGASYLVTITAQPVGHNCTFSGSAGGTIVSGTTSTVTVTCT